MQERLPSLSFSDAEKRQIIEEYLKGGKTKADVWRQFTGRHEEHGIIVKWMRRLGYVEKFRPSVITLPPMPAANKPQPSVEELQNKIKQLEQQLLDSQLKEEAYKRIIDIAEKELKVSIRKKPNTK
jgi:transposase-like protein